MKVNSMKRQKDPTLKDEPPMSVGVQYATEEEHRNSWMKNEVVPKQKGHPVVDTSCGEINSNAVKNNVAQDPRVLGPLIKVNRM